MTTMLLLFASLATAWAVIGIERGRKVIHGPHVRPGALLQAVEGVKLAMSLTDPVDALVIDAIANDYEDFTSICSQVQNWAREEGLQPTSRDIENALLRLIGNGLAAAYFLEATSAPTAVDRINRRRVRIDYYFLLTHEGRTLLS